MSADGQLTERRLDPPTLESAPEGELVKCTAGDGTRAA